MKTKLLLSGLVLPALFAACTADEFVAEQGAVKTDLSNRPVVGNVALDFGDSETRAMSADRNFNAIDFVAGEDGFGARIIDAMKVDASREDASGAIVPQLAYDITDGYASSNYKYTYGTDGKWNTSALMVEGNYMFYFPYNEKNISRTPVEVKVPLEQTVKPAVESKWHNNPVADLLKGEDPALIAYKFLSAEDQEPTIGLTLQHIFAYPQITLVNDYKETVSGQQVGKAITISKVLISGIKVKGTVNHTKVVKALREEAVSWYSDKTTLNTTTYPQGSWVYEDEKDAYFLKNAKTEDLVDFDVTTANEYITVNFEGGLTLQPGEKYYFIVVLPAAEYPAGTLKFKAYTADEQMFENAISLDQKLTYAPGKRYPTEEYNFLSDGTTKTKSTAGTLATVSLAGQLVPASDPTEYIYTSDDFEKFLQKITDNSKPVNEYVVSAQNPIENAGMYDFVLAKDANGKALLKVDEKLIELLKKYNQLSQTVTFQSAMEINGTENGLDLTNLIFKAGATLTEGNVNFYAAGSQKVEAVGLAVTGGSKLTISGDKEHIKLGDIVVKNGEVVVDNDNFIPTGDTSHANKLIASTDKDDKIGTVTLKKVGATSEAYSLTASHAELAGGKWVIGEGVSVRCNEGSFATTGVSGEITNNGTIDLQGNFTIAEGVTLVHKGKIKTNEKGIINNGRIDNYAELTVQNNKTIVTFVENNIPSRTVVTKGVGTIDNTNKASVTIISNGSDEENTDVDQTVVFKSDATTISELNALSPYKINKVILSGALTSDTDAALEEEIRAVEFGAGSSIYAGVNETVNLGNATITVTSNVTWGGFDNENSTIEFGEKANIVVAENCTLTIEHVQVVKLPNVTGTVVKNADVKEGEPTTTTQP